METPETPETPICNAFATPAGAILAGSPPPKSFQPGDRVQWLHSVTRGRSTRISTKKGTVMALLPGGRCRIAPNGGGRWITRPPADLRPASDPSLFEECLLAITTAMAAQRG